MSNTELSEFFSLVSKEKSENLEKLKTKINNPESDLANLFEQLENAHKETTKVSEEISVEKILTEEDQNRLEVFSNLMTSFDSVKEVPEEVKIVHDVDYDVELKEIEEPEEIIPEEIVKTDNIISDIVNALDEMGEKTEVKEEIDQISALRRDFDNFRNLIQRDISNQKMSGAGSGEVRLEFLDDIQRSTAKVDGKFLKYSSSDSKWIGADASGGGSSAADDISAGDAAVNITTTSGNITIDAAANNTDIIFKGTDGGSDITILTLDGSEAGAATFNSTVTTTGLTIGSTAVTSTAAELNILDGVTSTASELNLIDGGTSRGTTAVASGDGILINDAGTMAMTNVDTVSTYFASHSVGGGNIVTTGALDTGSITSGFGTIDTGASAITTTGLISGGSLDIDDVLINGTTIGHTDDTDLMTVADGVLTVAGELDAATLDISGNADIDGTLEADAYTVDGTALNEYIADTVGAMVSSNTETGITVTYQDGDNTIDFVVGTLNQDTTGTASLVTVTDSTANTNFPVTFHDESNALLDDTGALRYNPSTGTLLVPNLSVAGTTTTVDTVTMEAANAVIFEGATADGNETTLSIVDPTGDHTQYLINQGGYIPLLAAATTTAITSTPAELNILDGATVVVGEINALDLGSTAVGTAIASKAVILDSNKDYTGVRNFTITGELDAATLDISGNADIDGTLEADAITVDGTTLAEFIADTAGAMVSSNTETGITVTYQDGDNTIDFAVDAAQTAITSIYNSSLAIGYGSSHANINFGTDNQITFDIDGTGQIVLKDGVFHPVTDSDVDLGKSDKYWKDAYIDTITTTGLITSGSNLVIADDGTIGSSSDADAIAIASDGVVTFSQVPVLPNNTVETADVQDNAVTLAKMAGLARGKIIYGDSSGDPAALAAGSANYVLTSDGTDVAWAAASGGSVTAINNATANEVVTIGSTTTELDAEANLTFDGTTLATPSLNLGDEDMEHYDEGTWTPSLTTEGGSIAAYTLQEGVYVRIGEWVNCTGTIDVQTVSSPSGSVTMTGIPFTLPNNDGNQGAFSTNLNGWSDLGTASIHGTQTKNATTALIGKAGATGSINDIGGDLQNGCGMHFTISFSIV